MNKGLASILTPHQQGGQTDQRREERRTGIVDHARIFFRGKALDVKVVNISSRGTMIESAIDPRLGETILVEFPNCSGIHAFVRWVRDGQIGLNFGHEIVLAGRSIALDRR